MAKVVFESPGPKSAYEIAVVSGGDTMKDYERAALLDSFIADHGLVPVETTFHGEVPTHKYGRYKAGTDMTVPASALPPSLNDTSGDVVKLKAENAAKDAELARLRAQLDRRNTIVETADANQTATIGGAAIGTTEDARDALNQSDDYNLGGDETRVDMSTADRSDDNPKVDAPRRGRPPKGE